MVVERKGAAGVNLDVVTWTTLVDGFVKKGDMTSAQQEVERMVAARAAERGHVQHAGGWLGEEGRHGERATSSGAHGGRGREAKRGDVQHAA